MPETKPQFPWQPDGPSTGGDGSLEIIAHNLACLVERMDALLTHLGKGEA